MEYQRNNMKILKHRSNYWSCTLFADWLLSLVNLKKPTSETSSGWKNWNELTQKTHPIIYWIVEELLDNIQEVVLFPYDVYNTIRIYLLRRYITPTHIINTKLTPGVWHETEEVMLYGMFETLVNFIEVEKAHMNQYCKPAIDKVWYQRFRGLRWGENRSAIDGLEYLEWEMSLVTEDGNHFTRQAESAREQYELYNWWKNIRPYRPDAYEVTGWNGVNDKLPAISMWDLETTTIERDEMMRKSQAVNDLEEVWDKEDTEMLVRLIRIRQSLWT